MYGILLFDFQDILKGLTAVYPTCTTPTMGGDVDSSIGKPIILKEIQVWN